MGKELITLSMEFAKTKCYEFEFFEDNYSLTISTQGCRIMHGEMRMAFERVGRAIFEL